MSLVLLFSPPIAGEIAKDRRLVAWSNVKISVFEKEHLFIKDFVKKHIKDLPRYIQRRLITNFAKYYELAKESKNERAPYLGLIKAAKPYQAILKTSPFNNNFALRRDKIVEQEANLFADNCLKVQAGYVLTDDYQTNIQNLANDLFAFVESKGMEAPRKGSDLAALESAILRMQCEQWWLRKLRKARDQINEYFAIAAGLIGKGKNEYCSNACAKEYRKQQQANWAFLASMELVNEETEEVYNLKEIAEATTANPDNRRVELFVRIRGLEELAKDLGYEAFFVTWTAPSKYHKNSKKWNGAKPDETQNYLCKQWQKCRAKIARDKIDWFGVRVAEPHADSTPHWHMLVFCKPSKSKALRKNLRDYAVETDKAELLENHHAWVKAGKPHKKGTYQKNRRWYSPRFDVEKIDTEKGSATGYIAKYIAKNINAKNVENEPDFDGSGSLQDAASRVVAWAGRWRIRQFQFFGAARVSVWREFRRIKTALDNPVLEKIRRAAGIQGDKIKGDWAEFSRLIAVHDITFEHEDNGINEYNETVSIVKGLIVDGVALVTRATKWLVRSVGAANKSATGATWSTVNNCTQFLQGSSVSLADRAENALKNIGFDASFANTLLKGGQIAEARHGLNQAKGSRRGLKFREGQFLQFRI